LSEGGANARNQAVAELLEQYPSLEKEDIEQALEYAAWLAEEEVIRA
jgi:uncharacterized protein (DUF433 family)